MSGGEAAAGLHRPTYAHDASGSTWRALAAEVAPPTAASTGHDTVVRRFLAWAEGAADQPALRVLAAGGAERDVTVTWGEWAALATCVAAALVRDGVRPGDRVAVLAGNTLLWPIVDLGALMAGAITVGVFPSSTSGQAREILGDAAPRVVIVEGEAQAAKVRGAPIGVVSRIVSAGTAPTEGEDARALPWHDWLAGGAAAARGANGAHAAARVAAVSPDDVAGIIYTSGSTGEPKGACVSHAYLLASAESVVDALGLTCEDRSLSVLPFSHAAERVFGLYTRIVCGMETGLVADPSCVWAAARAFRPTLFGGLPRFYEKALDAARAAYPPDGAAWASFTAAGRQRSGHRRAGRPVPTELEAVWQSARGPAAAALAALFGDSLRLATSGGAPLAPAVGDVLDAVGLTVLGAYGQTEHLCGTFHRPGDYEFTSVGRPMLGTEVRVSEDGEVLLRRGALTFDGYWRRPDATRLAFTDDGEWLRTGDVGRLRPDGRLAITGRHREMLALSTGRKVQPLPIEARLAEHPAVAHAVLFGEGRKHVGALLFTRSSVAPGALAEHVAAVNATLAPHERIRRWALVAGELTEAAGELTATLKVRRAVIASRHAPAVEALFQ